MIPGSEKSVQHWSYSGSQNNISRERDKVTNEGIKATAIGAISTIADKVTAIGRARHMAGLIAGDDDALVSALRGELRGWVEAIVAGWGWDCYPIPERTRIPQGKMLHAVWDVPPSTQRERRVTGEVLRDMPIPLWKVILT